MKKLLTFLGLGVFALALTGCYHAEETDEYNEEVEEGGAVTVELEGETEGTVTVELEAEEEAAQ